jgi:2-keto-3-deoxy-L-rhamnonate aldolase RhmA
LKTLDGALEKIVKAGKVAGTLANDANVEKYTRLGVRMIMTSAMPWIAAGAQEFTRRAQAGARG